MNDANEPPDPPKPPSPPPYVPVPPKTRSVLPPELVRLAPKNSRGEAARRGWATRRSQ